jgi:hypothetical protein
MTFEIKKATRQGIKPLIGLYGKSGGGKTFSALLLARGLVGPTGRITLIDTESGRGSIFADIVPGGYSVIDFDSPFTPQRYSEAFTHAEKNSDIIVTDSLTHLWDGEGGILEMQEAELERMAGNDFQKRERCKMSAWIKPKMLLKRLTQGFLLRSPLPIICCLRAQEKVTEVLKDGKKQFLTAERAAPIFDHRFIFELLLNGEVVERNGKGGYFIPTKITHPGLAPFLPKENEQISVATGEAIAKWCAMAGGTAPANLKATTTAPTTPTATAQKSAGQTPLPPSGQTEAQAKKALMGRLYNLTVNIHKVTSVKPTDAEKAAGRLALEQYLWDEAIMNPDGETLATINTAALARIVKAVEARKK